MNSDSFHPNVKEITARSLIRKQKVTDSWFISSYTMNLYRGCSHNCAYCDGRAEGYYVDGEFGRDIQIKINAPELLEKELDPARKRTPFKTGYVLVGGGVGDSFQPLEKQYGITGKVLEVLERTRFPVHLITKSALITEYIDILKRLTLTRSVLVSFSFSTENDELSQIFEPGASLPSERLDAIRSLRSAGIHCGMFLMPVIPFITDTPDRINKTIRAGMNAGIEYLLFGGMTLKEGRQKICFYGTLHDRFKDFIPSYDIVYTGDRWGNASDEYYRYLNESFREAARQFSIPRRIPPRLFPRDIEINDRTAIILEHLDHFKKASGYDSTYGWAARSIRGLKEPLPDMRKRLRSISGIGPSTERLIYEILDTGTSSYYEKMLRS